MDQLAKETLEHDINPLTTVHYADLKPLVNSYIKQEVQTKWDVSIHGRDLHLVKPTLGPPKKFQHLTRSCNNPTSNWPHQGHKVPYLVPRTTNNLPALWPDSDPPTHAPGVYSVTTQSWRILHCWDSLGTLFGTVPEVCIVEFLREAGFFYLIWMAIYPEQLLILISHQMTRFWTRINLRNATRLCNLFIP